MANVCGSAAHPTGGRSSPPACARHAGAGARVFQDWQDIQARPGGIRGPRRPPASTQLSGPGAGTTVSGGLATGATGQRGRKPDSTCPATSNWPLIRTRHVTAPNPTGASALVSRRSGPPPAISRATRPPAGRSYSPARERKSRSADNTTRQCRRPEANRQHPPAEDIRPQPGHYGGQQLTPGQHERRRRELCMARKGENFGQMNGAPAKL